MYRSFSFSNGPLAMECYVGFTHYGFTHYDLIVTLASGLIGCTVSMHTHRTFQVIAAEGELNAARSLKEAADVIGRSPTALQLRYLQTLNTIAAERGSTIMFPIPMDVLGPMVRRCLLLLLYPPSPPPPQLFYILHFFPHARELVGKPLLLLSVVNHLPLCYRVLL